MTPYFFSIISFSSRVVQSLFYTKVFSIDIKNKEFNEDVCYSTLCRIFNVSGWILLEMVCSALVIPVDAVMESSH